MVILVHLANLLYLGAYLVRDILWLRVVTCMAGLILLSTFVNQAQLPWVAIGWNLVFFAINAYQIRRLLLERRPVKLLAEEQRLYQLAFRSLRPREFVRLLRVGELRDHAAGEVLVARGEALDRIMILVDGSASVRHDDRELATLGAGRFIGEMSFLTGEAPRADVCTTAPSRVAMWRSDVLKGFLEQNPELRSALQLVIGTDLVAKLRRPEIAPA